MWTGAVMADQADLGGTGFYSDPGCEPFIQASRVLGEQQPLCPPCIPRLGPTSPTPGVCGPLKLSEPQFCHFYFRLRDTCPTTFQEDPHKERYSSLGHEYSPWLRCSGPQRCLSRLSVAVFLQRKACLWAGGKPACEGLPPQPTSGPALAQANACQALFVFPEGHPPVFTLLRASQSTVW